MISCTRCNQLARIDYDAMLNVETGFTTVSDFEKPTSPPVAGYAVDHRRARRMTRPP